MSDVILMIVYASILCLVAVFVWAYKDQQYIEREIEWSIKELEIAVLIGELVERHYNVRKCIDKRINYAKERRIPQKVNVGIKDIDECNVEMYDVFEEDYWNGAYTELKELKEEIDEKNDKFHIKIEKITKEM